LGTKVPLARAAVERRQASAPAAEGRREPTLRGANRTRWCGHETLRLPAFRFLEFFSFFVIASEAKQSSRAVGLFRRVRSFRIAAWIASAYARRASADSNRPKLAARA
jgi:hypothetical protein